MVVEAYCMLLRPPVGSKAPYTTSINRYEMIWHFLKCCKNLICILSFVTMMQVR